MWDQLPERMVQKISPEPNSGCWLWEAACTAAGYAVYREAGQTKYVHRMLYELAKGSVPTGLELDHLCRVRCCVNPEHLEAVTHKENNKRGTSPMAIFGRATHCVHGHEFIPENTYIYPTGVGRRCRACDRRIEAARSKNRKR
jgi:hypothetical protein